MADNAAGALAELKRQRVDVLIVDVGGRGREADLAALGELVRARCGAAILILCPFDGAAWIADLMAFGPLHYLITPVADAELQDGLERALRQNAADARAQQAEAQAKEKELRELLAIQRSLQRALADPAAAGGVARQASLALCAFPGVRHSSVFLRQARGDLKLAAQESRNHIDLERLLRREDRLFQSPLREVFPAVLAAAGGALVWLDAPEKCGHGELAACLREKDVQMVLAVPLARDAAGLARGALCLMFGEHIRLSREQLACFASLAQTVSAALAMEALLLRNEELAERLARLESADGADGVEGGAAAARRQGEHCLSREIGRARRYALPLTLISFDIGNLREAGAKAGHADGARILRSALAAAQAKLRGADSLVRMSDEEFLIIAPHTAADDALKMADKIRSTVVGAGSAGRDDLSISLGVAQVGAGENGAAVLRRLDAALHRARRAGPNQVALATMQ
ncbi:MAG TPA: GGDEF domain-containing protein [Janthinobacterium sp.]|nr:GGDEF domain-containing protein [Janthinobacterium sp.]